MRDFSDFNEITTPHGSFLFFFFIYIPTFQSFIIKGHSFSISCYFLFLFSIPFNIYIILLTDN